MKRLYLVLVVLVVILSGCARTSLLVANGKKGLLGFQGTIVKKTSNSDKAQNIKTVTTITIEGENVKVEENSELK